MNGQDGIDVPDGMVMDHIARTCRHFFRWLKDRTHRDWPGKQPLLLHRCQDVHRAVDDGCMDVVTAGMHHPVALAFVGNWLGVGNRQGIDIATDGDP